MTTIHFPLAGLRAELDALKGACAFKEMYGEATGPGFFLVGDQGIYLMANHERPLPEGGTFPVVYPAECDPTTMEFDDWYDAKRAIFGGDDGADFLPIGNVEPWIMAWERASKPAELRLTRTKVELLLP